MLTSDVVKGTRIQLRNGWFATVEDNQKRQQTRMCTVEGIVTEMGSVYSSDIVAALIDGNWVKVEPTPAQVKAMGNRGIFG